MTALERASRVGLGTSRLRSASGGLGRADAVRFLQQSLEMGVTFYDTADIYGQGDAERALGEAFRGRRDAVVLATKVGYAMTAAASAAHRLKPLLQKASRLRTVARVVRRVRATSQEARTDAESMLSAARASLDRLQTDHVDVLYLHNPGDAPTSEQAEVLQRALQGGMCLRAGVAVDHLETARGWIETGLVSVVQVAAGLGALSSLAPRGDSHDAAVIGREVFSGGRHFDDAWRSDATVGLAEATRAALRRDALAYPRWLLDEDLVDHVIVGTTRVEHLRACVTATARTDSSGST